MEERFILKTHPQCDPGNVVQGKNYRFTVLTPRLIRMEYCHENCFEDHATQAILNRDFPKADFRVIKKEKSLEITTKYFRLRYDKKMFSQSGLSIEMLGNYSNYQNMWRYSDSLNDLRGNTL